MKDWANLLLTAISTGANVALLILSLKGKKKTAPKHSKRQKR
ncbi:MAG: hypothetical protein ACLS6Q_08040 [Christensenellaceae bacterium]